MGKRGGPIADKPNLKYFVVLLQFDGLWFVDCHEHLERDCGLEMKMCTNSSMTKTFVRWQM